jgi:hypothetical protein
MASHVFSKLPRDPGVRCGKSIRSRRALIFVNEAAQTVAVFDWYCSRIRATLDRWPAIRRREVQATMCAMTVVMLDELGQGSLKMPSAANQQPV